MKKLLLLMSLIVSHTAFSIEINWAKATGECEFVDTKQILPILIIPDPAQRFGLIAEAREKERGFYLQVGQWSDTNIAISLHDASLDASVTVQKNKPGKKTIQTLGAYSKELNTWISCTVALEDR